MSILSLIASSNFITVNKTIAKQIGVDAALLLGSLCSFGNLFAKAGGEFFVTIENLCDDTCLSRHKVKAALKTLSDTNIISIQKKGLPSRNYYTINSHKLQELLELQPVKTRIRSSWSKISPLVGETPSDEKLEQNSTSEETLSGSDISGHDISKTALDPVGQKSAHWSVKNQPTSDSKISPLLNKNKRNKNKINNNISFPDSSNSEKKINFISKNISHDVDSDLSEPQKKQNSSKLEPPANVEDVIKYFKAQDITTDPETFFNYYEARGWRGINNWEIAAKSWRDIGYKQNKNKKVSDGLNYEPLLKEYEEVAAASFRRIVEQNANKQH